MRPHPGFAALEVIVVDDETELGWDELCRACGVASAPLKAWVLEGALQPRAGSGPADWRFGGSSLGRARTAARLARDLHLDAPATALVLELLDRIRALEARLGGSG
jgi:chaperone modulatory protein CbpM